MSMRCTPGERKLPQDNKLPPALTGTDQIGISKSVTHRGLFHHSIDELTEHRSVSGGDMKFTVLSARIYARRQIRQQRRSQP